MGLGMRLVGYGGRVNVGGDSASAGANLASVDDTNTEWKFDWAHARMDAESC